MSGLSRDYKIKVAGIPMDLQLLIAPQSRDVFKVTGVTMLGTRSVTVSKDDLVGLQSQIIRALNAEPVNI